MRDLYSLELLRKFSQAEARFIVVGGVAAALLGSRLLTDDLDLVYEKSETNYARILPVLEDLAATFRGVPGKELAPTRRDLELNRINLFKTRLGKLDLLPTIGTGWTFEDLLPRSKWIPVEEFSIRVLQIEPLIESKRIADRPQDRAAIPILEELLARDADTDHQPDD